MQDFFYSALFERIAVHGLLADRAIRQPVVRLLHEVENHGAFAEANIFIADSRRSPAPRFPASKRAANEARGSARVDASHRDLMAPHGDSIIHQEIRSLVVADLPQSFGRQCLLT